MALKIVPRPKFRHKAVATVPTEAGPVAEEFHVVYRLASGEPEAGTRSIEFIRDIVVEIEDLVDEDGKPVVWSDEAFEAVLARPWACMAIVQGYFLAVNGARAGN